jgi:K+-sensing histidine kinase KdpD
MLVVASVIAIVVVYFRWVHVNPATVGFTFLPAILVISAIWGYLRHLHGDSCRRGVQLFLYATAVGVAVADPQNWIALFAFLFTAVVVSELPEPARREACRQISAAGRSSAENQNHRQKAAQSSNRNRGTYFSVGSIEVDTSESAAPDTWGTIEPIPALTGAALDETLALSLRSARS